MQRFTLAILVLASAACGTVTKTAVGNSNNVADANSLGNWPSQGKVVCSIDPNTAKTTNPNYALNANYEVDITPTSRYITVAFVDVEASYTRSADFMWDLPTVAASHDPEEIAGAQAGLINVYETVPVGAPLRMVGFALDIEHMTLSAYIWTGAGNGDGRVLTSYVSSACAYSK